MKFVHKIIMILLFCVGAFLAIALFFVGKHWLIGLSSIYWASLFYLLAPRYDDEEIWSYISLAIRENIFIKPLLFLFIFAPPLLVINGIVNGFLQSWVLGICYIALSLVLWIVLSPSVRIGGKRE